MTIIEVSLIKLTLLHLLCHGPALVWDGLLGTSGLLGGSKISDPPKTKISVIQEPPSYHNSTIVSLIFFMNKLTILLSFNLKEIFRSPPQRQDQHQLPQIKGNE